jgi:hypothetical protein
MNLGNSIFFQFLGQDRQDKPDNKDKTDKTGKLTTLINLARPESFFQKIGSDNV